MREPSPTSVFSIFSLGWRCCCHRCQVRPGQDTGQRAGKGGEGSAGSPVRTEQPPEEAGSLLGGVGGGYGGLSGRDRGASLTRVTVPCVSPPAGGVHLEHPHSSVVPGVLGKALAPPFVSFPEKSPVSYSTLPSPSANNPSVPPFLLAHCSLLTRQSHGWFPLLQFLLLDYPLPHPLPEHHCLSTGCNSRSHGHVTNCGLPADLASWQPCLPGIQPLYCAFAPAKPFAKKASALFILRDAW